MKTPRELMVLTWISLGEDMRVVRAKVSKVRDYMNELMVAIDVFCKEAGDEPHQD